jgi:predicted methyltransferase
MKQLESPQRIADEVATAVALVEGSSGVLEVIAAVAQLAPVGVRRISRRSELPVPVVAAICGELRSRGILTNERPARLTLLGKSLFEVAAVSSPSALCPTCEGREIVLPVATKEIETRLSRVEKAAPKARMEIDQSHCTVQTKLRRVLLLHQTGSLAGKRVLLLGDDDLTSLAIHYSAAQSWSPGFVRELVVVDVDPAILSFCRSRLSDAAFPLSLVNHDLRRPLPKNLQGRFDTVLTDPPYTPEGAELFLSRAASALSPRGGNVFLSFGMKTPEQILRIQASIAAMGFVIRRFMRNFNEYTGAGTLGGVSHLYHLTSTNQTRALIDDSFSGLLYTGERPRSRRYRCASCGAVETVGQGETFVTVADLKASGCRRCSTTKFRPLPRRVVPE